MLCTDTVPCTLFHGLNTVSCIIFYCVLCLAIRIISYGLYKNSAVCNVLMTG